MVLLSFALPRAWEVAVSQDAEKGSDRRQI